MTTQLELKEIQTKALFNRLIDCCRFDLIDLLAKADRKEISVVKINRQLVPSQVLHNAIIHYLKLNDVQIIQ